MLNDSKANKIFLLTVVLAIAFATTMLYSGNKKDLSNENVAIIDLKSSDSLEISTISNHITLKIDPRAKQASASLGGRKTANLSVGKTGSKVFVNVGPFLGGSFSFVPTNTARLVVTIPESYLASLSISTVSGDVDIIKDVAADTISINTISGKIDASNLNAENSVSIATVSGEISCHSIESKRKATIATTSGNIDINEVQGADLELRSVSSTVETTAKIKTGGNLKTSSSSGKIKLDLRGNENLSITAATISGGIRINSKEQENHAFSDRTGTGTTQVSAITTSGSINLLY